MREYTCREVKIPYSDMTVLRQAGKLKVWADFGTVSILYKSPEMIVGDKQPINFMTWYVLAAVAFLLSINLGLLNDGYVVLAMVIICLILCVVGERSQAKMKSFEANKEERLYETMQTFNEWLYKMTEECAEPYIIKEAISSGKASEPK